MALQLTQSYATSFSTLYDEARQLYTGEMYSRGGVYHFEGPSNLSVSMQMDRVLENEYLEMMSELAQQKPREFGSGISRAVGAGATVSRPARQDTPTITIKTDNERSLGRTLDAAAIALTGLSAYQGNWLQAGIGAGGMLLDDLSYRISPHRKKTAMLLAVSFGGILITAPTRRMLMKKLVLQRNKRLQLIMESIRKHQKNQREASSVENIGRFIAGRLRNKREMAEELGPKSWRQRTTPQGQDIEMRERSINLRTRIRNKRNEAEQLWVQRAV